MMNLKNFDSSCAEARSEAGDIHPASCMTMADDTSFILSDEVFSLFSDIIYRKAGIRLSSQKKILLSSRLAKRIRALGINGFYNYFQRLKNDEEELIEMLNCISTNTTHFFRENHHFEYFKNTIIPELLKNRPSGTAVRIWSAGCSTGEEPYSIAIAVLEALGQKAAGSAGPLPPTAGCNGLDIKILATDISTKVLETAMAGVYDHELLSGGLDAQVLSRYFLKGSGSNAGKVRVKDAVRDMISFRRLNLKDSVYPFKRRLDVIFCRNVMIYFDQQMKQHVIDKFHDHLQDDGHLFLGHSETMHSAEKFASVHITVYRKRNNVGE